MSARHRPLVSLLSSCILVAGATAPALAEGTTTRVSVNTDEAQGNQSSSGPTISADGRFVAFIGGRQPRPGRHERRQRHLRARPPEGTTDRVSVGRGRQGNGGSSIGSISADGRYVAFVRATEPRPGRHERYPGHLRARPRAGTTSGSASTPAGARQRRSGRRRSPPTAASSRSSARHQPRPRRHERRGRRLRARPPDAAPTERVERRLGRRRRGTAAALSPRSPPTAASWRSSARQQPRPGRHERCLGRLRARPPARARPSG